MVVFMIKLSLVCCILVVKENFTVKGIILSRRTGTCLYKLTKAISKQIIVNS